MIYSEALDDYDDYDDDDYDDYDDDDDDDDYDDYYKDAAHFTREYDHFLISTWVLKWHFVPCWTICMLQIECSVINATQIVWYKTR